MQVSNTILVIAAEIYIALLAGTIILFIHTRKLKSLINRQHEKLLALLHEHQKHEQQKNKQTSSGITSASAVNPTQSYKDYLTDLLNATAAQYALISPDGDISSAQTIDSPLFQRTLALRYAFLRSEELGTTEPIGSTEYWNIFQQALEPLLATGGSNNEELTSELDTYKKRISNLEKFKLLFFDMEKQWSNAQTNAQSYYAQLIAMSDQVANKEEFSDILQRYHSVYNDIHNTIIETIASPESVMLSANTRQDPHAVEEIAKLRNVAAEQHRTINQLQRKLLEATTTEEKEVVIQELEQQLQRQIRFVQESETCIQLLEDELHKAQEELSLQGQVLGAQTMISEENQRMKETLHNFSLESKDLVGSITELEKENEILKKATQHPPKDASSQQSSTVSPLELKKLQTEHTELKKQYADLEERYLDLKLGK